MSDKDERIARLKTPEECEQFATNVEKLGKHELALAARRRGVELRAESHKVSSLVEKEALEAVYAYERARSKNQKKNYKAVRTWRAIKDHGIIPTVERTVSRRDTAQGYTTLVDMGMEDMSFEAVVLRHPESFSSKAVERSKERLAEVRTIADKQKQRSTQQ